MVKEELIKRSPLRLFDKSIHGGLAKGKIGVIAARKGTGKTACLVHIATDQLFQNKHVIHVSFASRTDHIISWYEDIFGEIAKKQNLKNGMGIHDEIIKNRMIMNFNQAGIDVKQLLRSLQAIIRDGNFAADTIIIDGYNFEIGSPDVVAAIQEFAEQEQVSIWFSASIHRDDTRVDKNGVPILLSTYISYISVLITLTPEYQHVKLRLVKDYDKYRAEDMHLELDNRTLLINKKLNPS